jgi:hypothetical protein
MADFIQHHGHPTRNLLPGFLTIYSGCRLMGSRIMGSIG